MKQLPSFDELKEMAEKSPEKLESLRKDLIEDVINSAPKEKQNRLRGLQFQIDAKIKTSKTPFEALSKIYDEMMDSFDTLNEKLNEFEEVALNLKYDVDVVMGKDLSQNKEKINLKILKDK